MGELADLAEFSFHIVPVEQICVDGSHSRGNGATRRDNPYTRVSGMEIQCSAAARPLTPWTPAIKTTFLIDICLFSRVNARSTVLPRTTSDALQTTPGIGIAIRD